MVKKTENERFYGIIKYQEGPRFIKYTIGSSLVDLIEIPHTNHQTDFASKLKKQFELNSIPFKK